MYLQLPQELPRQHCKGETITMTDKYLAISGNAMHPAVQVPYVGGLPTACIYKVADKSMNYMVGRSWKPEDVQRFDTGREDGGLDMKDPMNWRESPGDFNPPSRQGVIRDGLKKTANRGVAVPAERARPKPPPPQSSTILGSNFNLTDEEKELLRWHQRLGHIGMKKVQWLMRQGIFGITETSRRLCNKAASLRQAPLCTACQYAKQRRKPAQGVVKVTKPESEKMLKTDNLFPGAQISVDHFQANPKGRLLHTFGREKYDDRFKVLS